MPERRATSRTVAAILLLRRFAEREARRQLEASRAQLERGRRRELLLQQRLRQAEQALLARAAAAPQRQPAQRLAADRAALVRLRDAVRRGAAELAEAAAQAHGAVRQVEQARERLLLAIARREAAELHEATERRERARFRARRAAALEEELAGRRRL